LEPRSGGLNLGRHFSAGNRRMENAASRQRQHEIHAVATRRISLFMNLAGP
jgi:hypothetical protein